jgi:hypothetical protein
VPLCARATPGFSGATPSGPRSHPANTDTGCAFASLGCAVVRFAASAKRHAFGCVHCPAASAPLRTLMRAAGPEARKTLRDREGSLDYPYPAWYWLPDKARSWLPVLLHGRVRVFAALAPLHAKPCRGCEGGAAKKPRLCEQMRAVSGQRGCKPVRDTRAPKNQNSTCARSARASTGVCYIMLIFSLRHTNVDRRRMIVIHGRCSSQTFRTIRERI